MVAPSKKQLYVDHLINRPNDKDQLRFLKEEALALIGGRNVYKYCSLSSAHRILTSGLLLQTPDNFNDPFDCLAGVHNWSRQYKFPPEASDVDYALSVARQLPDKYQLRNYVILDDMRAAYYFAMSCFAERYDEHLMWSHYAEYHKGVCLAFDVSEISEDLHPCTYTHSMPSDIAWRSGNLALALIKGSAWAYEKEWRVIRKTIRPSMRVIGSITGQIYNAIHTNPLYSTTEHEEWGEISSELQKRIENEYNQQRLISIKPSKVFLGLKFYYQYANTITGRMCDELREITESEKISVNRMRVLPNSFDLVSSDVVGKAGWSQPW